MSIGVAISTTGQEHRLGLLARSIAMWRAALGSERGTTEGIPIFVTIDGSSEDAARVVEHVGYEPVQFYRVGQVGGGIPHRLMYLNFDAHMGVAVNKNTGLELLMDQSQVEHLFLSDDDTWPLSPEALALHTDLGTSSGILHSMVCWGNSRLARIAEDPDGTQWAEWTWPRGVVLYQHRSAVEMIGGMDERFGPGGHEHVEYSQRMHNSLMTPADFCSPAVYAGDRAMEARRFWHAEDMRKPYETAGAYRLRKRRHTSIHRQEGDWEKINAVMAERQGSTDYVSYRASDNGRESATLCAAPSRGAGGEG